MLSCRRDTTLIHIYKTNLKIKYIHSIKQEKNQNRNNSEISNNKLSFLLHTSSRPLLSRSYLIAVGQRGPTPTPTPRSNFNLHKALVSDSLTYTSPPQSESRRIQNTQISIMSKIHVRSSDAPAPAPFLSQATVVGNIVFCSGQLGIDPKTEKIVEGSVKDRTVCYQAPLLSLYITSNKALPLLYRKNANTEPR